MSTTQSGRRSDPMWPGASGSVTDTQGFDRGTGSGEPSADVAHNLRLMKSTDDAYNARDYDFFMGKRHHPDVLVHQIGAPDTRGHGPHRRDMDMMIAGFPDMRVHNNPYDIQFGQGEWTAVLGKLSGTFTQPLTFPDGTVIEPTGKAFTTFFCTIARWQNDLMVEEFVLFDPRDLMSQVGVNM
ncbi:MAG: ester cyclase [Solirubrobacterales bacterium]|nr:ester cyclase [Solirubrobacterales bacterium]